MMLGSINILIPLLTPFHRADVEFLSILTTLHFGWNHPEKTRIIKFFVLNAGGSFDPQICPGSNQLDKSFLFYQLIISLWGFYGERKLVLNCNYVTMYLYIVHFDAIHYLSK